METEVTYREVQYFRQPWLLIVMAGIILLNIWGVVQQIVLGQPWGDNSASNEILLLIFLLSGLLFPILILSVNLRVKVRKDWPTVSSPCTCTTERFYGRISPDMKWSPTIRCVISEIGAFDTGS